MSNHLGNVLSVVSDRKLPVDDGLGAIAYYQPDVVSYSDYYPFGMLLDGRKGGVRLRNSFQGQEQDPEVKGDGNSINYKYRMHDPRVGRFFAVDPLAPEYPFYSPYAFSGNQVIHMIEVEGLEPRTPRYQTARSSPAIRSYKARTSIQSARNSQHRSNIRQSVQNNNYNNSNSSSNNQPVRQFRQFRSDGNNPYTSRGVGSSITEIRPQRSTPKRLSDILDNLHTVAEDFNEKFKQIELIREKTVLEGQKAQISYTLIFYDESEAMEFDELQTVWETVYQEELIKAIETIDKITGDNPMLPSKELNAPKIAEARTKMKLGLSPMERLIQHYENIERTGDAKLNFESRPIDVIR